MTFHQKTIIVTGASSGIGRACAEEFASRGANLILGARQYLTLCEITADLEKRYPIRAVAVQCDVSAEEECQELVKQAVTTFGRIDVLVNNAGISMRALFGDLDLSVIRKVMEVNFWGTVYCTKYALPELLRARGTVVGVSSIAGYTGLPGRTGYSASKFAMNGFLSALRIENLKTGLHVMVVSPGFTASNIRNVALNQDGNSQGESSMDEGKMMPAAAVAKRIADGVANRERSQVMTGTGKLTVFLNKTFPALLDKLVFRHFTREKDPLIR